MIFSVKIKRGIELKIKAVAGGWKHARLFLDTSALLNSCLPEGIIVT